MWLYMRACASARVYKNDTILGSNGVEAAGREKFQLCFLVWSVAPNVRINLVRF